METIHGLYQLRSAITADAASKQNLMQWAGKTSNVIAVMERFFWLFEVKMRVSHNAIVPVLTYVPDVGIDEGNCCKAEWESMRRFLWCV